MQRPETEQMAAQHVMWAAHLRSLLDSLPDAPPPFTLIQHDSIRLQSVLERGRTLHFPQWQLAVARQPRRAAGDKLAEVHRHELGAMQREQPAHGP
jgi:hypothetical protein